MKNNYSNRLEMQIPQENAYTQIAIKPNFDDEFEKLSKNYTLHKTEKVKDFIKNNLGLINYINRITTMINKHFPDHSKCMTFSEDYEFEELNDVTIFINSSEESFNNDCKKFDELEIEILKLQEFPKNIKNLISVDLWLL